ncbi:hypothetical protein ATN84_22550 [Paramesorhizobium deserti]|uniref:FAD-binding domain-containing protein n=2 Tax=Paramesorhizobium deserti TaxID=1494590 RepID=A0A135HN92_9HYPH|nr:hypothetical protein ATN84_22550 [Paramesorhizobium deserti]
MEALDRLGVARDLETHSLRLGASVVYNERGLVGRLDPYPPESRFPHTYVASQSVLDDLLAERARCLGVQVEWNTECTGVENRADETVATFADGSRTIYDWVIGADGAHSTVRGAAGIAFEGFGTGQAFYLADLKLESPLSTDMSATVLGREGPMMMMRISEDPRQWRLFVDVTEHAKEKDDEDSFDPAELLRARGARLSAPQINDVEWRSLYRVQVRHARAYRSGRVFLAGDAAHVFPPFGGQGMNTGILDAFNLCWKLALFERGLADSRLLETYHAERWPIGAQVIAEVEQRRRSFALRNPLARAARDAAFWLLTRSRFLERRVSRQLSQLDQHYRDRSWLSEQTNSSRSARAGDRAPDGVWQGRRLHELFSPTAFTLIVFGKTAERHLDRHGLPVTMIRINSDQEEGTRLRRAYDAGDGTLILVRPDGHIGFRGRTDDWGILERYLGTIHRAPPADRNKGGITAVH